MKIYIAHSTGFDFRKELYEPIESSELARESEFILPHIGAIANSKKIIESSDLLIAEISYPSISVGIEMGWADSFHKRIVCVYKVGSKIPASLEYLPCTKFEYSDGPSLISVLRKVISS